MSLFDQDTPLTPADLITFDTALSNTQGNILKSHGRHHTFNVFLRFHGDAAEIKKAICELAAHVTSAKDQSEQVPLDHALVAGFGLSAEGYRYLGIPLDGFSPAFQGGMTRAGSELKPPVFAEWDEKFRQTPHAMILLAHADLNALNAAYRERTAHFAALAEIASEQGTAIFMGDQPKEHFGFIDGISQPLFFQAQVARQGSTDHWDPGAGPNLVLIKDPRGASDDDCGSYFVFRKLKQDVQGFRQREAELQGRMPPTRDPSHAGAMLVGRFRDGTPLALNPNPNGLRENDFRFGNSVKSSDPYERRCPHSAHIRKVNPRNDTGHPDVERMRRIARRGITYGVEGSEDVGLLFQCCQKDLENQFEFIQGKWIDSLRAPGGDAGLDPIAGTTHEPRNQTWFTTWGTAALVVWPPFDFGGFVTLKGGAYFFLPSLTFLRNI